MATPKPVPGVAKGDHVYVDHPDHGAMAVRVLATGRDGFTGVDGAGKRHGCAWDAYRGHRKRVAQPFKLVDQGADGALLEGADGKRRYVAGEVPADDGKDRSPANFDTPVHDETAGLTPPKPPTRKDDPVMGRMGLLTKALADGAPVLFLKAGPVANRPGLSLKTVTDKSGRQTKRWVRDDPTAPAGKEPEKTKQPEAPDTAKTEAPAKRRPKPASDGGGQATGSIGKLHGVRKLSKEEDDAEFKETMRKEAAAAKGEAGKGAPSVKPTPMEPEPAPQSPGDAPMKHGDTVAFRHGDVEGQGKIVASGADGVTVHDGEREHQVRHEHLTGKAPDEATETAVAAVEAAQKPLDVLRTIKAKPADKWTTEDKTAWQAALAALKELFGAMPGTTGGAAAPNGGQPDQHALPPPSGMKPPAGQPAKPAAATAPAGAPPLPAGRKPLVANKEDRWKTSFSKALLLFKSTSAAPDGAKPLYISRAVTNGADIAKHYRDQGCSPIVDPADMHCTVCYSKAPVDWLGMGDAPDSVTVPPSDARSTEPLGDKGAHVLHFESPHLQERHADLRGRGASHDFPSYRTHVTVSYGGTGFDTAKPWTGPIELGPERYREIPPDWKPTMTKAMPTVLLFKAAIRGGALGDLLSTVTVAGHTHGGKYVGPYQAARHTKVEPPAAPKAPVPATQAETDPRMRKLAAIQNRDTKHEVVVTHADGRVHRLGYTGRKSGAGLVEIASKYGPRMVSVLGLEPTARMKLASKHDLHVDGGHRVHFTGRTQRDAIMSGEHPHITEAKSKTELDAEHAATLAAMKPSERAPGLGL